MMSPVGVGERLFRPQLRLRAAIAVLETIRDPESIASISLRFGPG